MITLRKHSQANGQTTHLGILGRLIQKSADYLADYRRRRVDRVAINQLLQLDDNLLKDMGLKRSDLIAVQCGSLSVDALVKRSIQLNRDNAGSAPAYQR